MSLHWAAIVAVAFSLACTKSEPQEGDWLVDHDAAVALAKAHKRPMMIDFWATWCEPCLKLDRITYRDPAVLGEAERFVLLKVDATENDDASSVILKRYGVLGLPTVVFIDSFGKILDSPRVSGFAEPDRMLALMKQVR